MYKYFQTYVPKLNDIFHNLEITFSKRPSLTQSFHNGPPRLLICHQRAVHKRWTMLTHCNLKQNMCASSKQSSLFSFYRLPSGGKSKDAEVRININLIKQVCEIIQLSWLVSQFSFYRVTKNNFWPNFVKILYILESIGKIIKNQSIS